MLAEDVGRHYSGIRSLPFLFSFSLSLAHGSILTEILSEKAA